MNGSANDGFEEFVCQLARREEILWTKEFVRNGKPDGGVECYKIFEDGSEVAWQAKFFCKAFGDSQYQRINGSVKEALNTHPNLRRYIIAVPIDPSDAHVEGRMSMKKRIDGYVERWSELNPHVAFEFGGTGSSRAREFHPHPLTEPCVKVSPHTALHIQRFVHRHNLSQMVLLLSSHPPLCLRVV